MFYEKKKIYKGCIENVFIKLRDFVIFERVCKDKRNIPYGVKIDAMMMMRQDSYLFIAQNIQKKKCQ